jgi:MoaA/NifB/PqqE/SkfB family radical SAM enzyme
MKVAGYSWPTLVRDGLNVARAWPSHRLGRTLTRPLSVNLILTTRCNSRCATCDSWRLPRGAELTLADYQRLAAEAAALGATVVTLGGGEPLLRRDLWDIVAALKRHGRLVQLTTNGLALTPARRRRLVASGVDRVTVSVDSHRPEVYARLRGVDAQARVEAHLRALLRERPAHLQVDTNTVLCRENAPSFLATLDHLLALGVDAVSFSAVTTAPANYLFAEDKAPLATIPPATVAAIVRGLLARRRRDRRVAPSTRFIRGLARYFAAPQELVYPCLAGYLTLDVFADGAVHGCGNLPPVGHVATASLGEIWRSAAAAAGRRDMAAGRCPNCYLSCKAELAIAANPRYLPGFALERLGVGSGRGGAR